MELTLGLEIWWQWSGSIPALLSNFHTQGEPQGPENMAVNAGSGAGLILAHGAQFGLWTSSASLMRPVRPKLEHHYIKPVFPKLFIPGTHFLWIKMTAHFTHQCACWIQSMSPILYALITQPGPNPAMKGQCSRSPNLAHFFFFARQFCC